MSKQLKEAIACVASCAISILIGILLGIAWL
jgi:hypothetical protein